MVLFVSIYSWPFGLVVVLYSFGFPTILPRTLYETSFKLSNLLLSLPICGLVEPVRIVTT